MDLSEPTCCRYDILPILVRHAVGDLGFGVEPEIGLFLPTIGFLTDVDVCVDFDVPTLRRTAVEIVGVENLCFGMEGVLGKRAEVRRQRPCAGARGECAALP